MTANPDVCFRRASEGIGEVYPTHAADDSVQPEPGKSARQLHLLNGWHHEQPSPPVFCGDRLNHRREPKCAPENCPTQKRAYSEAAIEQSTHPAEPSAIAH